LAKFRPNFTKFDNFGGGQNFCNTEIKNPAPHACDLQMSIPSPVDLQATKAVLIEQNVIKIISSKINWLETATNLASSS
jgi:hypothetical protein